MFYYKTIKIKKVYARALTLRVSAHSMIEPTTHVSWFFHMCSISYVSQAISASESTVWDVAVGPTTQQIAVK